jgi:hypothetical protein
VALETASYVANLVESNPDGLDQRSTADNHLRLIKAALKRTFPQMDGPVSLSSAQVMYLGDVSASVQLQLNQLRDGSATANNALYANSASHAAVAGNALAVGGFSHSDVAVLARVADQTFVGAIVIKTSSAVGSAALRPGSSSNPGYVEFRTAEGTRRGFVGFGSGTRLLFQAENNWGFDFSGSVAPTIAGNAILHAASQLPATNLVGSVPNASVPLSAVQQHQGSLAVASATTASSASTASNAGAVNGYGASEAAAGSTVVARTAAGYAYATYFNQTSSNEGGTPTSVMVITGSDGFLRKMVPSTFGSQIAAQNISGRTGTAKNLAAGSGPPSLGGSTNGDFFYYY